MAEMKENSLEEQIKNILTKPHTYAKLPKKSESSLMIQIYQLGSFDQHWFSYSIFKQDALYSLRRIYHLRYNDKNQFFFRNSNTYGFDTMLSKNIVDQLIASVPKAISQPNYEDRIILDGTRRGLILIGSNKVNLYWVQDVDVDPKLDIWFNDSIMVLGKLCPPFKK